MKTLFAFILGITVTTGAYEYDEIGYNSRVEQCVESTTAKYPDLHRNDVILACQQAVK